MTDTDLHSALDTLDTGLPERPDLTAVVAAGRRQRRRRRLGIGAGAGLAAAALVVPAAVLAGGLASPDRTAHRAVAAHETTHQRPVSVAPADLAGPEFGVGMTQAVQQAFPDAQLRDEQLADGWAKSTTMKDTYDWTVQSPPNWATLFSWDQTFNLSGGRTLDVVASRVTDTHQDPDLGDPGPTSCAEVQYPAAKSCSSQTVGANTVVVNDGVQFDSKPGRWYREIEIFYFDATRGTMAHVNLGTWVNAPSWAQADQQLPSVDQLVALGREQALVLPAPDHYPGLTG